MAVSIKRVSILLIILGGLGFLILQKVLSKSGEKGAGPGKGGPGGKSGGGPMAQKVAVKLYTVKPVSFQDKITATGTVVANEEVDIRSEISGRLTRINFKEGSTVRKGQVLLAINDAEMRAQLRKLQANLQLYRNMAERQRKLLEKEYISQQEYEEASNKASTAAADIQALQASLNKAYVRAPFDGVLGLRQVSEGTYVTPTTPITRLVDISPVKIDFSVPEKYAQSVKIGDEILFSVEGQPNTYKATVFALEPNIDVATRSMQVRARYANTKESVKPGSFVKVEVPLKNIESAIMVPTEAIVPEAAGHMLYLAKAGKAVPQPVKIGIRSETLIQITEGVQAGDTIIRSGILQVRPGADLDVKEVK